MKKTLLNASLLATASLLSAAPAMAQTATPDCNKALIGKWLGRDMVSGSQFLIEQKADGQFDLHVKTAGQVNHTTGRWGCSNGLYASWTQTFNGLQVDSNKPTSSDVYAVVSLTDTEWVFKDVRSGSNYTFNRVAADYAF